MADHNDTAAERMARLEEFLKEHKINYEDLEAYLRMAKARLRKEAEDAEFRLLRKRV